MADFTETRKLLEHELQKRGDETLDLGGVKVERGFTGEVQIIDGGKTYSMDRVPAEVFERLSAALLRYNDLSTDGGIQ